MGLYMKQGLLSTSTLHGAHGLHPIRSDPTVAEQKESVQKFQNMTEESLLVWVPRKGSELTACGSASLSSNVPTTSNHTKEMIISTRRWEATGTISTPSYNQETQGKNSYPASCKIAFH